MSKNQSPTLTDKERDLMFAYYLETRSLSEVSRKFNRNRKTVQRIARLMDWTGMEKKIAADRQAAIIRGQVKKDIEDIDLITGLQTAVMTKLLNKDGTIGVEPTIVDAVRLTRLKQELLGNIPGAEPNPSGSTVVNHIAVGDGADNLARRPESEANAIRLDIADTYLHHVGAH